MNKENKIPLAYHLLYLFLSAVICYLYYKKIVAPANFSAENSIDKVITFHTMKPYQFRLLIPFIFQAFKLLWFVPEKTIYIIYDFVIVYLIVVVYHKVLSEYFRNKTALLLIAPFILYPIFWNYIILNQTFQYYDFTTILIYTIGLYYLLKEKFGCMLIVYIIGLINKETIVYLVFAYIFFNYKIMFTKKIVINTMLLSGLFVVYKLFLNFIFQNNSGSPVEISFLSNIETIKLLPYNRIYQKDIFLNFGPLYIFILLLFFSGRWKMYPDRRKVYMNLVFVPYLLLGIFITYFSEVRVYTELIPAVTTLFVIYLGTFKKFNMQPIDVFAKQEK